MSGVCCLLFPFLVWRPWIVLYLFSLPGKGEEQALAATVLTLLCLQMGSGPEGEEIFRSLKPLLITILTDSSASPVARQSVSIVFFSGLQQRVCSKRRCIRIFALNDFTFPSFLPSLILSPHWQCATALGMCCYIAAADMEVSHCCCRYGGSLFGISRGLVLISLLCCCWGRLL